MPRKQNGFGTPKANQGFKGVSNRTDVGRIKGAAGYYPSDRRFGSTINRSAIEQFDIDSDWSAWRKGLEYYYQFAWYRLKNFDTDPSSSTFDEYVDLDFSSKLYQGTPEEVEVKFDGYKFATKESDTNNHFVIKRNIVNPPDLGTVAAIRADKLLYPTNFQNKEVHVQLTTTADTALLTNMSGDRVTDGVTEATVKKVLTSNGRPALYVGKTSTTKVFVEVPTAELMANSFIQANNNQLFSVVGKIGYLRNLYTRRAIGSEVFTDDRETFDVTINSSETAQTFEILDQQTLPANLYDISGLTPVFTTSNAVPQIQGTYTFQKNKYQAEYGTQYLTADLIASEVTELSYSVLPFIIKSIIDQNDGTTLVEAEIFPGELKLYASATNGFFVFTDFSFTKLVRDEYNGSYYHTETPTGTDWLRLETDIDPWMDEIFTSGNSLKPATIYACSCPAYSHAKLAMPQEGQDEMEKRNNRQARYPLPTAKGKADADNVGLAKAAGKISSWENERTRLGFKQCKHTIAAKFIENIKTKEPNKYPSQDSRDKFEKKLKGEISTVGSEFTDSYRRGGLSEEELIFAMGKSLNLDEIELAYIMLFS